LNLALIHFLPQASNTFSGGLLEMSGRHLVHFLIYRKAFRPAHPKQTELNSWSLQWRTWNVARCVQLHSNTLWI